MYWFLWACYHLLKFFRTIVGELSFLGGASETVLIELGE